MFKSLLLYRIKPEFSFPFDEMETAIKKVTFEECGPTQQKSVGWVPPRRQEHGAMIESVGGQWVMTYCVEAKILPASVVNRKLAQRMAAIEEKEGRKPGKKEKRELKDEVLIDLLPSSHTSIKMVSVWIDPQNRLLAIDTTSQTVADEIVTMLVEAWPGFSISLLNTQISPRAVMADWLVTQEPADGFSLGRECELKSDGEDKAVVRYGRHPLDITEITEHIKQGKLPTKLALVFDDRVSFTLTEGFRLTKVQLLDVAIADANADQEQEQFDADVALTTGELRIVIAALTQAFGGESEDGQGAELLPDRAAVTTGSAAPAEQSSESAMSDSGDVPWK